MSILTDLHRVEKSSYYIYEFAGTNSSDCGIDVPLDGDPR